MSRTPRTTITASMVLVFMLGFAAHASAQLTVRLTATPSDVQFAGTPVVMQAAASGASESAVFQFAYRPYFSTEWRIVRDFYYLDRFDWVTLADGLYELRVTARINSTNETATASTFVLMTSFGRLVPTVSSTPHPLIALYSAPSCTAGGLMRVRFRREGAVYWQYTTPKYCAGQGGLTFHIAGLRANTNYVLQHEAFTSGPTAYGPQLPFRTGTPAGPLATASIQVPASTTTELRQPVVLQASIGNAPYAYPTATDLTGSVIWYYPLVQATLTRPLLGGNMLILARDGYNGRLLREIDLAGNVVRETSTDEVSRQLVALGHDPIGAFHHEAIRLTNGHTLAIASVERILVDEQGPGPVHVYGEMIVDLDANLQVAWAWNAFDHLDTTRAALLGETCTYEGPGCPALFLGPLAKDWLHANSIGYVADDGNLIMSLRHQDWVIKIDYQNGAGSGAVLWKAGPGGDFTLSSGDPWPWFSHQHDAKLAGGHLLVYDNGNTRVQETGSGNSRGQAYTLDETAMTATLDLNLDLGAYLSALGSAQGLLNGSFHFDSGFNGPPTAPYGDAVEVRPDGTVTFVSRLNTFVYRSFRMSDLYRP
jgi:arylsulfate sulfotransferase